MIEAARIARPGVSPRKQLYKMARRTILHPVPASIIALFLLWLLAMVFVPPSVLPAPWTVARELVETIESGTLVEDLALSLYRIVAGWLAAMVVAIVIGVLMGSKGMINEILRDYILVFMSLPLLIWVLLAVVWFGGAITASIVAIVMVAAPQGAVGIYEGVCNVERELIDAARVYKVPTRDILLRIMVPSLLPFIVAMARQSFAQAWKTISLLEIFGAAGGIGYQIEGAFDRNSMAGVLAWLVVFICVMLLIEAFVFGNVERYIFRWRPAIGEVK